MRTAPTKHAACSAQPPASAILEATLTVTVPDAPALIRELASDPALLIGAGTVPDSATAEACLAAGYVATRLPDGKGVRFRRMKRK